jgi:hypothetical protein
MKVAAKILMSGIFCFQLQFLNCQNISMIEGGNNHTNVYQTKALKGQPKLKWKFETGSPVNRLAIDNGIVFFGSGNFMYAIEQ